MTISINKNNKKNIVQHFNEHPLNKLEFKSDGYNYPTLFNDGKTLAFYPHNAEFFYQDIANEILGTGSYCPDAHSRSVVIFDWDEKDNKWSKPFFLNYKNIINFEKKNNNVDLKKEDILMKFNPHQPSDQNSDPFLQNDKYIYIGSNNIYEDDDNKRKFYFYDCKKKKLISLDKKTSDIIMAGNFDSTGTIYAQFRSSVPSKNLVEKQLSKLDDKYKIKNDKVEENEFFLHKSLEDVDDEISAKKLVKFKKNYHLDVYKMKDTKNGPSIVKKITTIDMPLNDDFSYLNDIKSNGFIKYDYLKDLWKADIFYRSRSYGQPDDLEYKNINGNTIKSRIVTQSFQVSKNFVAVNVNDWKNKNAVLMININTKEIQIIPENTRYIESWRDSIGLSSDGNTFMIHSIMSSNHINNSKNNVKIYEYNSKKKNM